MNDKNINKSLTSKFNSKHILIIGIALRLIYFVINLIVGGNHIDEAMLGLNSYYLANGLTDAAGERLPIYFDTWLYGGQSPLPTYLSALSVKLFGMNLFAVRLPMLIVSIIGLVFFYLFIEEVFKTDREKIIMNGIACISPWLIFSSAYVLDCNYLAHMMIIAFYFMARAINTKKLKYYAFSMVFFALGFYCYIASVLIIPVILATMYLILLIKKKIGFKELAVSVITVLLVSTPFILFGLVNIDVLPDLNFLGLNISKMPYYERASTVAMNGNGAVDYIITGFSNLLDSALIILVPETNMVAIGLNLFHYSNLLGGLLIIFSSVLLLISLIKKNDVFSFLQKFFFVSGTAGILSFCFNVNDSAYSTAYRYGIFTYSLLLVEGIGIICLIKHLNKKAIFRALLIYLVLSFAIFNYGFFGRYTKQVNNTPDIIYGDSMYSCLDKAKALSSNQVIIIEDNPEGQTRASVYCRNYFINDAPDNLININAEFIEIKKKSNLNSAITKDNYISFSSSEDCKFADENLYIIRSTELKELDRIPDGYTTEDMGSWSIIYKA